MWNNKKYCFHNCFVPRGYPENFVRFGTRYLILPKFGLDVKGSMYRASKSAYENA